MKKLLALILITCVSSNFYVTPAKADECSDDGGWWVWDSGYQAYVCVPVGCWSNPVTHDVECHPR